MIQSVTTSDNKTIKLTTDNRIKRDAIRILRTIKPEIGKIYADTRKKGIRYKIAENGSFRMNIQDKQALVVKLNNLYMRAGVNAIAYIHQEQNGFKRDRVCVLIKK